MFGAYLINYFRSALMPTGLVFGRRSPNTHHSRNIGKVELALKESGLSYERYEIDLKNKPEWYAPKVNPASKVREFITTF